VFRRFRNRWSEAAEYAHYGSPTRLLDFTESAYIAAFFAYEDTPKFIPFNETEFIAIWIINASWLKIETINKLLNDDEFLIKLKERTEIDYEAFKQQKKSRLDMGLEKEVKELEERFFDVLEQNIIKYFGDFFIDSNHKTNIIYPIKPSTLTMRFHIQQGMFLCSTNLDSSFMEALESYSEYSNNVFLVLLPKNERGDAFRDFCRTNITREHLFPGLDGFAQSLLNSISNVEY